MSHFEQLPLRENLRHLVRLLGLLEKSEAACCSLSLTQCHALTEIGRSHSMSLNELADTLQLDKSTLSRSVNQLVDDEILKRSAQSDDRRYVSIELTEKGQVLYDNTEQTMYDYYSKIMASIPSEKRSQVIESLELLNNALTDSKCCL